MRTLSEFNKLTESEIVEKLLMSEDLTIKYDPNTLIISEVHVN